MLRVLLLLPFAGHAATRAAAAPSEEEFQGFKLKGGSRAAANIPGPLPRYGSSAGLQYMLLAAPAKQVSWLHG